MGWGDSIAQEPNTNYGIIKRRHQAKNRRPSVQLRFSSNANCIMPKRSLEEVEAVDVRALGREWRFTSGMAVQDALRHVSDDLAWNPTLLAMDMVEEGALPITLHDAAKLTTGFNYKVRVRRVQHMSPLPRRFGTGVAVQPDVYYFVSPHVDALVNDLKLGKYCALCGPRQSGKSTAVLAARARLAVESDACVIYIAGGISSANKSWGPSTLWSCLAIELHMACPMLFRAWSPEESCSEQMFRSLFLKTNLPLPVMLVLDEADTMLDLSADCLDHLFHVIRLMRNDRNLYNLHSILLVGVETVRDLLEAQYDRRVDDALGKGRVYQPGSTPSRRSPFPHDHIHSSTQFIVEDVVSLLSQAAADRPRVAIDVQEIAVSIMELTAGHKGLTGTCLAYLVQEELWTVEQWSKHVESYSLKTYVFGQATYNKILQFIKKQSQHKELLVKLLQKEEIACDNEMVVMLRDYIAGGVVVVNPDEDTGQYLVGLSSPLLRSSILQWCVLSFDAVDPPPCGTNLDREWVLLQAIKSLDGEIMCRPQCLKAGGDPSEYAQQFLFMCRIKSILKQAYPLIPAVVVPEAKEIAVPGRKRKQLRLDILVRDSDKFSKFAFELIANGSRASIIEHVERAKVYQKLHSAQVFVINFCMDKVDEQIVMPNDDSVIFVSVNFKPVNNCVRATFVDTNGKREVDCTLKKWDGQISLDALFVQN